VPSAASSGVVPDAGKGVDRVENGRMGNASHIEVVGRRKGRAGSKERSGLWTKIRPPTAGHGAWWKHSQGHRPAGASPGEGLRKLVYRSDSHRYGKMWPVAASRRSLDPKETGYLQ
jgi:hypothetical protein